MKTNYVIAGYNGTFPPTKRRHSEPEAKDVLRYHLKRVNEVDLDVDQITIMRPSSENTYADYYEVVEDRSRNIVMVDCENYGYSLGQWLKCYEMYEDQFDYYCFIEDDYCANIKNFDAVLNRVYRQKFPSNVGVLCSLVEGSEDYAHKGGYPIHFEGCVYISSETLKVMYDYIKSHYSMSPRAMLDQLDNKIDSGFNWNQLKQQYRGGYYQVVFSHLFTLAGIKHEHYLGVDGLEFPYWGDYQAAPLNGFVQFYNTPTDRRTKYTKEDIANSPVTPIQLSTTKGIDMNMNRPKVLFLIGMHRSGTSLLSNCLVENGFDIGVAKNQDKDWQNPNGYFENDQLAAAHNYLLKYNGCEYNMITKDKMFYTKQHVESYRMLMKQEFDGQDLILIKDPRLSFFKDFLEEVCEGFYDPYFVFCTRDKQECCESLTKAQGIPLAVSERLYDQTHQQYTSDCLMIDHRDTLNNNSEVVSSIMSMCGLEVTKDTNSIVDPNLYRSRNTTTPTLQRSDITAVVVSYYRGERLDKCLDTIGSSMDVIVWDNDTQGEELERVKSAQQSHPNAQFIYSKENVGLTKAWNQGIIQSNTDWVLLTCDDMLFDDDWFDVLNDILRQKPYLEQIHLNAWNAIVVHKKTIARMGWWDERYRYYPSMEDDDWYLRTVECLQYSPYGTWAEHIPFSADYINAIKPYVDQKKHCYHREDNFTYYCNSIYSRHKVIGASTTTGGKDDAGSRNNAENASTIPESAINGVQFHHTKWQQVDPRNTPIDNQRVLLGKDGRCWVRVEEECDWYPEERNKYAIKYFNINLLDTV